VVNPTQDARTCRRAVVLLALSVACSQAEVRGAPAPAFVSFKIAGSSALLPFVAQAANAYMKAHSDVAIQVNAGGSPAGLAQVAAGTVAVGTSDLFALGDGAPQQNPEMMLEDHKIGVIGFAAMGNRGPFNQSITSLTKEQLRRIFTGQARDWSQVGGGSQPITVLSRATGTGSRTTFGATVLGGDPIAPGSVELENSSQVQTMLLQTAGAISYLALSYRRDELAVFALDAVPPSAENIETGAYPVWSYEHMYTRGPASGQVRAFIDFILSAPMQRDALPRLGFIPIGAMKVSRDHD
jgi:phosphate transport system substrate-binding protein